MTMNVPAGTVIVPEGMCHLKAKFLGYPYQGHVCKCLVYAKINYLDRYLFTGIFNYDIYTFKCRTY